MNIKDVQTKEFDLLCLVDSICEKENVPYFLHAGTELGSVREKDIIPWDDDVDIKVTLENYPAFKKAMLKHLPSYIHLIEPIDFQPGFYDFLVRIVDARYYLRKITEEDMYYKNYQNHIGIDVFILHRIPEMKIARGFAYGRLMFWYGLGMGHRYSLDFNKYPGFKKIIVFLLSRLGRHIPVETIWNGYYKDITCFNSKSSTIAMNNYLSWDAMISTKWIEHSTYGVLRGRKFPVPAGFDAELSTYYGDYKHPPKDFHVYNMHLDEADRYQVD